MSVNELKKDLKEKNVIFGTERVIKLLKQGKLKKIFVCSNCEEFSLKRIKHYCKIGNIELYQLKESNEEIGVICKKPFSISVVGV